MSWETNKSSKRLKNNKTKTWLWICLFSISCALNSCSPQYVKLVDSDTPVDFGMTFTAPSQGIFFVENESASDSQENIQYHLRSANSIFNAYGPSTDQRYLGRTNARQLKFNLKKKTYLIDITKLKHRTAMIMFDGKNKPIIEYDAKKYKQEFLQYFYSH